MTKRGPATPHCRATLSHTVRQSRIGARSKTEKKKETETERAGAGGSPLPQPAEAGVAEGWSPRASLPKRRQRQVPLRGPSAPGSPRRRSAATAGGLGIRPRNCRCRARVCGRCAGGHPTDGCTATPPPVCPQLPGPAPGLGQNLPLPMGDPRMPPVPPERVQAGTQGPEARRWRHLAAAPRGAALAGPPPPPTEPRPPSLSPPVGPEPTRPRSADQGATAGALVADSGQEGISESGSQGGDSVSVTGPSEAHPSPSAAKTSPFGSAPTATSSPITRDSSHTDPAPDDLADTTLKATTSRSRPTLSTTPASPLASFPNPGSMPW